MGIYNIKYAKSSHIINCKNNVIGNVWVHVCRSVCLDIRACVWHDAALRSIVLKDVVIVSRNCLVWCFVSIKVSDWFAVLSLTQSDIFILRTNRNRSFKNLSTFVNFSPKFSTFVNTSFSLQGGLESHSMFHLLFRLWTKIPIIL